MLSQKYIALQMDYRYVRLGDNCTYFPATGQGPSLDAASMVSMAGYKNILAYSPWKFAVRGLAQILYVAHIYDVVHWRAWQRPNGSSSMLPSTYMRPESRTLICEYELSATRRSDYVIHILLVSGRFP